MASDDPLKNIRIVLCETSHPGNIGASARAMKNMGLADLHLVNPERFPDPECTWRAARAADVLEKVQVHASLSAALDGVALAVACTTRPREIAVPCVDGRESAARALEVARSQHVAYVFGNETYGLTGDDVNKCQLLATIPTDAAYPSLNLAAAVQVFTYELRMAAAIDAPLAADRELATHEALEAFYEHLERVMGETGYMNREHPKKLMPRLRRLFGRAGLEKEEVNILRGIFKALSTPKNRDS